MQTIPSKSVFTANSTLRAASLMVALWVLGLPAPPEARPAESYRNWTGNVNGLWGNALNWSPSLVPLGNPDLQLVFPCGERLQSTNDLVPPQGENYHYVYRGMQINCGGYQIYGRGVVLSNLVARYPAGASSTLGLDVQAADTWFSDLLAINVVTNNSALVISGDVNLTNGRLLVQGAGDLTISGTISGTGSVYKASSGDLRFSGLGANTYGGGTNYYSITYATNGTLRLNRYLLMPGPTVIGAVAVSSHRLYIGTGTNGPASDLVVLERDDQIADYTDVRVNGTGQLDLNDHDDTIGFLELVGGSVVTRTGTLTVVNAISCFPLPAAKSVITGKLALCSAADAYFNMHFAGTGLQIDAMISGGAATTLNKTDLDGELILTADNTYSGPTLVSGGMLTLMHDHALGSTFSGTTITNGQIRLVDVSIARESLTVGGPAALWSDGHSNFWSGSIVLSNTLTLAADRNNTLVLSNIISGDDGIITQGPGTVRLDGDLGNTYEGATIVGDGTLLLAKSAREAAVPGALILGGQTPGVGGTVRLGGSGQIADTSDVVMSPESLFDLNGFAETIGTLSGSGWVNLTSHGLTSRGALSIGNVVDCTYNGVFTDSGTLEKQGLGRLTLTGHSTHSGRTTVGSGELRLNGSLSNSSVRVEAGAELSGEGTVQDLNVLAGGIVSPGASTGILTATGAVTLAGTLEVELNGTSAGTGYDQLQVGGVTLSPTANLSVTLNFIPPAGATFKIIDNRGTDPVSGTFNGLPQGAVFILGGIPFQIGYNRDHGNDVVLTRLQGPPVTNTITHYAETAVEIEAQGVPGYPYIIEATPHLNTPIPWTPVSTNIADNMGLIQFFEQDISLYPQRFYRIGSP